jgi:endonuclease-3 related protein
LNQIEEIFKILFDRYGPQYWWPAETPFEVIVGAILTQATNWNNVEKAINNLKKHNLLDPYSIHNISEKDLSNLIKPCGFYKIKAKRLKSFIEVFINKFDGNIPKMNIYPTSYLRKELLKINGIGMETADSILLYALNRPVFVIDNYTKRLFHCLGLGDYKLPYEKWQQIFHNFLFPIYQLYQEYHALIVEHGKRKCRRCNDKCFLKKALYLNPTFG